jgi:hypothetical protein
MQTAEDIANEIPTVNNTVIILQHKLFRRYNCMILISFDLFLIILSFKIFFSAF